MKKPILHFSHANGFPSATYHKLFSYLKQDFTIGYMPLHGHHPDFPVNDNWTNLVEEVIHCIEQNYSEPVFGVGHSLGGVLTFAAALKRPDLFTSFLMLDAPVPTRFRSTMMYIIKRFGFVERVTPGKRTKNRRTKWPSQKAAIEYFQSKPLFKNFDKDCLRDYVKYGMRKTKDGIELEFDRGIEYKIYLTLPHKIPNLKSKLTVPASLLCGQYSRVCTKADKAYMKKRFNMQVHSIPAGHLFPFEKPTLTAELIKSIWQSMV